MTQYQPQRPDLPPLAPQYAPPPQAFPPREPRFQWDGTTVAGLVLVAFGVFMVVGAALSTVIPAVLVTCAFALVTGAVLVFVVAPLVRKAERERRLRGR
jgi:uncharacterized membrane protein HdeD (DUF308 family)